MDNLDEKQLKAGIPFVFETKDKNDIRGGEILFERGKFFFWFNGKILNISKTVATAQKRLNELNGRWDLEQITHA